MKLPLYVKSGWFLYGSYIGLFALTFGLFHPRHPEIVVFILKGLLFLLTTVLYHVVSRPEIPRVLSWGWALLSLGFLVEFLSSFSKLPFDLCFSHLLFAFGIITITHGFTTTIKGHREREEALKEAEERARYLACHDPLTGVYNRYALEEFLSREIPRAKRYNRKIGVLMVDVDDLKVINDKFGHKAGDELLKEVAKRLRNAVRKEDLVVRYGGDEFLVILTETKGDPQEIAKRIEDILSGTKAPHGIDVRVSAGASLWDPREHEEIDPAIARADRLMYSRKQSKKEEL